MEVGGAAQNRLGGLQPPEPPPLDPPLRSGGTPETYSEQYRLPETNSYLWKQDTDSVYYRLTVTGGTNWDWQRPVKTNSDHQSSPQNNSDQWRLPDTDSDQFRLP